MTRRLKRSEILSVFLLLLTLSTISLILMNSTVKKKRSDDLAMKFPASMRRYQRGLALVKQNIDSKKLLKWVIRHNTNPPVINGDIFRPIKHTSTVIVVQVHNRMKYLEHLVASLSQIDGISKALLIFSHDFYNDVINKYIENIDFCKVVQIFFPYSMQLYPTEFPGNSPKDSERRQQRKWALMANPNFVDTYGHFREANVTQIKHHWWWKLNMVFEKLELTKNHEGMFLFVEEDHYLLQDSLYVLNKMKELLKECSYCNLLSLGNYVESYTGYDTNMAMITAWRSSQHNMGMAFNKTTFLEIKKCAEYFCTYDDYNWDWSLEQVSKKCLTNRLFTIVLQGPRIFHIGHCGIHHYDDKCGARETMKNILKIYKRVDDRLYPKNIETFEVADVYGDLQLINNGGWGDTRDHNLCKSMVKEAV